MSARATLAQEFAVAAAALEAMLAGAALPAALGQAIAAAAPALPADSLPAVQDIAYGSTRQLGLCRELGAILNAHPPAPAVAALQIVALAQLLEPLRAAAITVDQAVAGARLRRVTEPAAGFLNATLRRFVRERDDLLVRALRNDEARWNFPRWWIEQLRRDHPGNWEAILAVSNQAPPMTLRVNRRRFARDEYLAQLAAAGVKARPVGPQALVLENARAVAALPEFAAGTVSIQDAGAQLAAPLLDVADGMRVLDACAAPGGKTTHILELADCDVTALDVAADRLARVAQNLERQGLHARLVEGSALEPQLWWDGVQFDRILVDAPCTASGIVRRHPDVRWLRRRSDLATLSARQVEILARLWPLLRVGGKLLYATCSVFRAEGEGVVDRFRRAHRDAIRCDLAWRFEGSDAPEPVDQLLPRSDSLRDHDGFFYAMLEKSA
ncbi:MAG: 16S rRNA (cytosine(967)-C(5))-methyltransferase RsmB [Burkholderiaceae bacterium]|nr:16S rRNA (cytosine(967)-C(5))-methyltransferase RsmB [Burkholderiaceae bacterium]